MSTHEPFVDALAQVDSRVQALRKIKRALERTQKVFSRAADEDFGNLQQAEAALSRVLDDTQELAGAVPLAVSIAADAKSRLTSLRKERMEVRRRREELARLAAVNGWRTSHTGDIDHVGPFTLHHASEWAKISYGSLSIARLKYPSPVQLAEAIGGHERKLDADARHHFEEFLIAMAREQEQISKTEAISWPAVLEALVPSAAERKRMRRILLWRLGLLIAGRAPGGWTVQTAPPNLQEMPQAWSVPRVDRPNDPVRLFRIRLIHGEGGTPKDRHK